jgi:hypothetical protein
MQSGRKKNQPSSSKIQEKQRQNISKMFVTVHLVLMTLVFIQALDPTVQEGSHLQ